MVTAQKSDPQTSDSTKVGQYKRWTSTNDGPLQTSDGYIYKEKRRTLVEFEKKTIVIRNKLKSTHLL